MAKPIDTNKGFTLIELLIYLGLVAIIAVIFTGFTADVVKNSAKALVVKEVSQNSRLIMARLDQEIKTARSIDSLSANQINLTDRESQGVTLTYSSTDQKIYYNNGGGDVAINNENVRVTNLVFTQTSDSAIKIDITIEQKRINPPQSLQHSVTLTSTVIPRHTLY